MTDARFPERWLNDRRVLRLSDAGFRLFVISLVWSVANRSDGVIHDDDLPLLPSGADAARSGELEKVGLWRRDRDRWLIVDFLSTQSTRDELDRLESIRRSEREKKARQRAKNSAGPRDGPRDSPGRPHRQAGQAGKAGQEGEPSHDETQEPNGWPEVQPPGSGFPVAAPSTDDETWQQLARGYNR